jgi:hypothetical protein
VIKEGLTKDFKSAIVEDIVLLQKIYAGIEEPDGLIGIPLSLSPHSFLTQFIEKISLLTCKR